MLVDLNMRHQRRCSFQRNGEDIEFKEEGFQELAYNIATGPHKFENCLDVLGLELTFETEQHKLEVLFEQEHHWQRGRAILYMKRK